MPEFFIIIGLVLATIVFAIVGFINCVVWLFASPRKPTPTNEPRTAKPGVARPNLKDDVAASHRLIIHLRQTRQINAKAYDQLHIFLETKLDLDAKPDLKPVAGEHQPATGSPPPTESKIEPATAPIEEPSRSPSLPASEAPPISGNVVSASDIEIISTGSATRDNALSESGAIPPSTRAHQHPSPSKPAPWDLPDPPVAPPRRSFAEMMSGFMEEKNMRWGELTSGILIVLSAVGLVVSLREELQNTIPYFSALLFMLITAAIHGAGIYTLKKWKLRNTSRGTLVIGLLLVPLNFVAACILSGGEERREWNDPWLWTAMVVGISGFAAMTWWSSKCLLRRGQWPMVVAIMGAGLGTLLVNRLAESTSSGLQLLLLALPIGASFMVGTCLFDQRQWVRQRWTERSVNRLLLFLGISAFTTVTALSLLVIRSDSTWTGVVSATPIVSIVFLMTAWLGSITMRGASGKSETSLRFVGLVLQILGLILLAGTLGVSLSNPTLFVVTATIASFGLVAMFLHQQHEKMLPIAWAVLAAGILAALNLAIGNFSLDQWCSFEQWKSAIISGQSGLCLLVIGIGVVVLHLSLGQRFVTEANRESHRVVGWLSGGGIFLVGCLIALVASFVDRSNQFDAMTASGLLLLAAVGAIAACVVASRRSGFGSVAYLPHVTPLLVFGGLAHALIWNRSISTAFDSMTGGIGAGWMTVVAISGLVMALLAWQTSGNEKSPADITAGNGFAGWASAASATVMVGAFFFIEYHTGWATLFVLAASISCLLIGLALLRGELFSAKDPISAPFVFSTGLLLVVAIADLGVRLAWCPDIAVPRHWLIQIMGLAVWSMVWGASSLVFRLNDRWSWLTVSELRVDQIALGGVTIALGAIVSVPLIAGVGHELFVDFDAERLLLWTGQMGWVLATLGTVGVALIVTTIERPRPIKGAGLVIVWMLAWAFAATPFEGALSVGSAIRWLLPIGGIVLAVLLANRRPAVPVWVVGRHRLGCSGPSKWKNRSTQQLINLSLAIVVTVVLLISTLTTARVLLDGVSSLGGPASGAWFRRIPAEISFGMPIAMIVGTCLLYAVSERRRWLAMAGSAVFQYVVVMAIVLLIASPHPQLASAWFLNILQAVSLGMTGYGFVWLWMRDRIEGDDAGGKIDPFLPIGDRKNWVPPIEIHTLFNGLLITSLVVLVMGRFFLVPDQPGGWIGSVGSPLGLLAWGLFGALALGVWWRQLSNIGSTVTWLWLVGWMGLNGVGLLAAVIDQRFENATDFVPWLTFNVVTIGVTVVALLQTCLVFLIGPYANASHLARLRLMFGGKASPKAGLSQHVDFSTGNQPVGLGSVHSSWTSSWVAWPILVSSAIGLLFAVRGVWLNPASLGIYIATMTVLTILIAFVGGALRSSGLAFVAMAMAGVGVTMVRLADPMGWFARDSQPYWLNMMTIATTVLAIGWTGFYLYLRRIRRESIARKFVVMPNVVLLGGAIWVFASSVLLAEWKSGAIFSNPMGVVAGASVIGLWILSIWNDRARFRVVTGCLLSLAVAIELTSRMVTSGSWMFVGLNLVSAMVVGTWGWLWLKRVGLIRSAKGWGVTRLVASERSVARQLPIYSLIVTVVVLVGASLAILFAGDRGQRYAAAAIPFALAFAWGCQSDAARRRWMQILCLTLLTLGGIFLAWADLVPDEMLAFSMLRPLVRCLIVLAGAMFVYGGLVTRWVRAGDTWIRSLREMAVATCGIAVICLVLVIIDEAMAFEKGVGCGLSMAEGTTVAMLVMGMIVGLITIAIRPENDPFALSLKGRMGYVYAAQFVSAALVAHLYFSMPFLFQFGIQEYWPFIAMAICFGGVGVAQVLEKRNLTVLAQPLFHVAAILPVIVAAGLFTVDSKADISLVMLIVGMAYLMISYTHRSVLSGAGAVLFGNLALWMFFHRYPDFSFFRHPQLWVIPPAVSVLIAGHLSRKSLTAGQLATLRYVCVAIIYVGSTSEIFIDGVGDRLWPPVVLAGLAVAGILSGIMLQIKSFLYFGSLFLLMAMITMVAHAQQRLDHVWPWWAFGIGLGIAILVMFGMFEKRKKEMKAIANRLKKWDE